MTFTRRQWAALLGVSPLLAAAPAQVPPPAPPEPKLEKANADVRDARQRLAEIEVPIDIEPAFQFTA